MLFFILNIPSDQVAIILVSIQFAQVVEIVLLFIISKMINSYSQDKCFYTIWEENGMDIVQIRLLLFQLMVNSLKNKRRYTMQYTNPRKLCWKLLSQE